MEFREVLDRRKMIRSFQDRAIDPAVVDRILTAAVRAPSAGHTQGWGFLVLTEPDDRRRFWHVAWPPDERDGGPRGSVRNAGLIIAQSSSSTRGAATAPCPGRL